MSLSCEEALQVIAAAQARARVLGLKVAVAVVDEGGQLQALARMDGATPLSSQIAEAKASGAALLHRDGGSLQQLQQERPAFFTAVDRMARVPLVPGPGSVLIKRDGAVLGAVGVSGATPLQDLDCAQAGLGLPTAA